MLKLTGISKSFGEKKVLENFSYDFGEKGVVCISGASGCGKTTLLRIISGLEKSQSGDILLSGTVSFMFQEDRLLPWLSAWENVACVLNKKSAERKARAFELLKLVGLEGNENEQIPNLSGGMKRRVAFARAIAVEPDILLLDEAFTGLDEENRKKLSSLVSEAAKDHLVIMVTHDSEDIDSLADRVVAL
ncbi:MAG: ATP-binding cassette domain-containing protein [Oscillospiraceae bacterium]|nr:ATP-binding cassette domain-containing protein [Oscillospiraceae bacterium]